jgi:hydrogenase nickel incorporation protein HypA/HybF
MHEMSLAMGIVDLVTAKAEDGAAKKINQVELEVGQLSGVMVEALTFCFEAAAKDTLAQGAQLDVVRVEGRARCLACETSFAAESLVMQCPKCESYATDIVQGKELRVLSLVVDE